VVDSTAVELGSASSWRLPTRIAHGDMAAGLAFVELDGAPRQRSPSASALCVGDQALT
jgi:hypothetical protein